MIVSCIVAKAKNNAIGKDNQIPWYLPADLKYFKKVTSGHMIIMGRKCYESIGRPLPKRTNVIVTRNPFYISTGCVVVHSIDEALEFAFENGEEEVFIIGGGTIYDQTIDEWDKLYLTEVDIEPEADIFFNMPDLSNWKKMSEITHKADHKNKFDYTFLVYERIQETE